MKSKIIDSKRDVINTLAYKKIFKQPLTFYQLVYFCQHEFKTLREIEEVLAELLEKKKIKYRGGFYYLNKLKFKDEDIFVKKKSSLEILEEIEKYLFLFKSIPFIKFIGITGSLASFMFDSEKDDIDLFFIVERNRLWLTRLLVVGYLKLLKIYVNDSQGKIKFCPNFYISEDRMSWEETQRNIYVAHEIVMMQPYYDSGGVYFDFLKANTWISGFMPNFHFHLCETYTNPLKHYRTWLDVIDQISMWLQKNMMKVRYGSEVLQKDIIHFLKYDNSSWVLESFEKDKS